MLRAFWTYDPIPDRRDDDKWFFDKSVWQKMFRTMNTCQFNAMFFSAAEVLPCMIGLSVCPDDNLIDEAAADGYQQMYHWIFQNALDYDIAPYLVLNPLRVPSDADPVEYIRHCMAALLDTYTELSGIVLEGDAAPQNIKLIQQAVVDVLDAARPDAALIIRAGGVDADFITSSLTRRGNRKIGYCVKYTSDHLVDHNNDEAFARWVDAVDGENIIAEFGFANFEPWTCFSFDTITNILSNLTEAGCLGLAPLPLSPGQWPHVSDSFFKYQWQRDLIWYSAWGGMGIEQLKRQNRPKWLIRNFRLISGFEAASRIIELLTLYFAGDRTSAWRPQYCSVETERGPHLMSLSDMLQPGGLSEYSGRDWWEEITGDPAIHLGEYILKGAPENTYGPEELIEELTDLAGLAVAAGEKGLRSASGEKELPSFSRDALCMGRLGEFYVERIRGALSHAREENAEAAEHVARALGLYRELVDIDSTHREPFAPAWRQTTICGSWEPILNVLEREYADVQKGVFKSGRDYPIN